MISIDGDTLRLEARTALGELYDAFTLRKRAGQANALIEQGPGTPERHPQIPAEEPKAKAALAPAVCICDITGPGLPRLRITPEGAEPDDASDLAENEGRIVFENGPDDDSRMAFPIFHPNEARRLLAGRKQKTKLDTARSPEIPTACIDPAFPLHLALHKSAGIRKWGTVLRFSARNSGSGGGNRGRST